MDVLVKSLATQILPAIFEQRTLEKSERNRIDELIRSVAGGAAVLAKRNSMARASPSPHCFLAPDISCDSAAQQILEDGQLGSPALDANQTGLFFQCHSSIAIEQDTNAHIYTLWLGFTGRVYCQCLDFSQRGGACKHIRTAILRAHMLRIGGIALPDIPIPSSEGQS